MKNTLVVELELKMNGEPDDRIFLNFWDSERGNDVCCQIIDGKLIHQVYDQYDTEKEITLTEFINLVQNSNNSL